MVPFLKILKIKKWIGIIQKIKKIILTEKIYNIVIKLVFMTENELKDCFNSL